MPKFFDRVILDIIILLTTLIWASYVIKNTVWVVVSTVTVYLAVKILYLFLFNRYKNLKTLPSGEMEFLFSIKTPDEQAKFLIKTLPESAISYKENNYFCVLIDGKPSLVFCFYKFLPIGNEDIAKAWRTAKEKKILNIYFIGRTPTRQTMLLTRRLALRAHFVTALQLKKFLVAHNAMPEPILQKKEKRERLPLLTLLQEIFHPRRAKYFAFSGIILALMSFFTPLKLYYLVLASIALAVSAVSIIMKRYYT